MVSEEKREISDTRMVLYVLAGIAIGIFWGYLLLFWW